MSFSKHADIFDYVHHPAKDGTWRVLETRTGKVIHQGLSEDEAIAAALLACANQNCLPGDGLTFEPLDLI
jgi:hypothetical protein